MNKHTCTGLQQELRSESIKNFFINIALNAGLAYWLMKEHSVLTAWGEQGYGVDLLVTGFLLSTILGCIFIQMYRRKRGNSEYPILQVNDLGLLSHIPFNPWIATLVFSLLGVVIAVPLLLGLLALFGVSVLSPLNYALVKGLWSGLLAALLVPLAMLQGLRATPPSVKNTAAP